MAATRMSFATLLEVFNVVAPSPNDRSLTLRKIKASA
jgi:hypothetical protein